MFLKIALVAVALSSCYQSQKNENETILVLHPVEELPQTPESKASPVLIGGRAADPKDWPASMYADLSGARCTATLVGERVLLIAAHCVSSGGKAQFKAAGLTYTAVCTHSKDYAGNSTADYAACEVDSPVVNVPFEVVNIDPNLVKVGEEVLLTGFGCTVPGGSGGNDGVYRIGESVVSRVPQGNDNDIITRGPAALCYGDSGGPAFKVVGNKRYQLSVNSRGDIRTTSYLSSLATAQGKRFLTAWVDKFGHKICGMHEDAVNCRGSDGPGPSPTPPPPPPPGKCKESYDFLGKCLFSTGTLMVAPATCYQAAGFMFACLEEKYK